MTYNLKMLPSAQKEWDKLNPDLKNQFKKKLKERLENPRVPSAALSGTELVDCYKIKLVSAGYRLVYRVEDEFLIVEVIAIGKREKSLIYEKAKSRR